MTRSQFLLSICTYYSLRNPTTLGLSSNGIILLVYKSYSLGDLVFQRRTLFSNGHTQSGKSSRTVKQKCCQDIIYKIIIGVKSLLLTWSLSTLVRIQENQRLTVLDLTLSSDRLWFRGTKDNRMSRRCFRSIPSFTVYKGREMSSSSDTPRYS